MTVVCGLCGKEYQSNRKIDHVKKTALHKSEASELFITEHIKDKVCGVCKKPFQGIAKNHVIRKHLGKAAKEYATTF